MPNVIDSHYNSLGLTMIGSSASLDERDKQMLNKSRSFFHLLYSVSERLQTTPAVCESLSQLIEGSISHQQCLERLKELLRFNDSSRNTFSIFINDILPVLRRLILSDNFDYSLLPVRQCDKTKVQHAMQSSSPLPSVTTNYPRPPPSNMAVADNTPRQMRPNVPVTLRPVGATVPANYRHIQPRPNTASSTQFQRPYYSVMNGINPVRVPSMDMSSVRIVQGVNVLSVPPQTKSSGVYPTGTPVADTKTIAGVSPVLSTTGISPSVAVPLAKRPRHDVSASESDLVSHAEHHTETKTQSQGSLSTSLVKASSSVPGQPVTVAPPAADNQKLYLCKLLRARLENLLVKTSSSAVKPNTTASSSNSNPTASTTQLTSINEDAIVALSVAVDTYLRDIYSELALQAKARIIQLSSTIEHDSTSQIDNTQAQLNFLTEVDKAEQQRGILRDQENCRRAAQSKSRDLDPATQQLKDRYKEMTTARQEQEAMNASNLTALQAIGGRQKLRAWEMPSLEESSESLLRGINASGIGSFSEDNPSLNPTFSSNRGLPSTTTWTSRLPNGTLVNQRYRLHHEDLVRHVRSQRLLTETNAFRKILSKQLSSSSSTKHT